jgi:hypothetical protein
VSDLRCGGFAIVFVERGDVDPVDCVAVETAAKQASDSTFCVRDEKGYSDPCFELRARALHLKARAVALGAWRVALEAR